MNTPREQWRSPSGFILATVGSAVGLGNIWRFSYIAGESGGGSFLVIYLICVVLVGAPIVIAELTLGRRAQGDAVSAFEQIAPGSLWRLGGWIGVAAGILILSYYSVIAGWTLKYLVGALSGSLWAIASDGYGRYFQTFISNPGEPIAWQLAMMAVAMFIVAGGVQRGIETANRVLMPLLAAIVLGLAIYGLTLPGSAEGWRFLFAPSWDAFHRPEVYIAALGQAFFSIGIGMAVFITYGSYMTRQFSIPASAGAIVAGDTLFAIVAGLAIFPAVFALGIDPAAGPQLAFITLPQTFLLMAGGILVGTVFFLLLVAAAITSMIALLEVPVAFLIHHYGWRRWLAVGCVGTASFIIGLPAAMSFGLLAEFKLADKGILDAMDHAVSNYMLPAGGMLIALFVGWRWSRSEALEASDFGASLLGRTWIWLLRLVAPLLIVFILFGAGGDL